MTEPLPLPPMLRRVPGGWVGFVDGAAWPVRDPAGVAEWPGTVWRLADGALLAEPADEAPPAVPHAPPPALQLTPRPPKAAQSAMPGMRLLRGDAPALVVPRPWLERLVPWPGLQSLPFAPASVLGLALAGGAVLVLAGPANLPLLAVLRVRGRLIGLGCAEAHPDAYPGAHSGAYPGAHPGAYPGAHPDAYPGAHRGETDWLPEEALALAPLAPPEVAQVEQPSIALLFCQAGGIRFALPALEVDAVLPPVLPAAAPLGSGAIRGVVAHRGQVLPVLDAGLALGGTAALAGKEVPMLRLAGPSGVPVAVAVAVVEGLRRVPLTALSPAAHGGPMRAVCWPAEVAVPVLEPAWLARGA